MTMDPVKAVKPQTPRASGRCPALPQMTAAPQGAATTWQMLLPSAVLGQLLWRVQVGVRRVSRETVSQNYTKRVTFRGSFSGAEL